jgi:hypothetical protein
VSYVEDELLGAFGETLFHYTTLAAAIEHILPAMSLRMSPFSAMRDPRESKRWAVAGAGYVGDDEQVGRTRREEFEFLLNQLKDTCKLLSFAEDDPDGEPGYRRGFARPRLWEQYGGRSAGVCLAFDREKLTYTLRSQLDGSIRFDHGPVAYRDERLSRQLFFDMTPSPESVTERLEAHLDEHWHDLFFVKLTDWSTEHEYRFVTRTDHTDPVFVDVPDALIAVCLGQDTPPQYFPALVELVRGTHVRLRKMLWWNNEPHVVGFSEPPRPFPDSGAE